MIIITFRSQEEGQHIFLPLLTIWFVCLCLCLIYVMAKPDEYFKTFVDHYIYDVFWFNIYLFWRTKTLVIWYIDLELLWLMPTGNVLWNCLWGFFQSRSDCYKTKWTNTFYPHILWTNAIFFSFFGQVCNCFHFLISHCSHCLVCANGIQQISCKK